MRENDKTGGNELHSKATRSRHRLAHVLRVAPGLRNLLGYRREWLRHDAVAGVSVSAVALPTAIAYAELIGFEPVVGLYWRGQLPKRWAKR
jgi:hypothetical protein